MNLCFDKGNSRTKIGVFDGDTLIYSTFSKKVSAHSVAELLEKYPINASIISSVAGFDEAVLQKLNAKISRVLLLDYQTKIPIFNAYKTPETLGNDRLAAVVGANFLKPKTDCLVIDAGTAITFDFIDSEGVYRGGAISAGVKMRFRALHEFTQQLPYVETTKSIADLGNDTRSSIESGVLRGVLFEIEGHIATMRAKFPSLSVFLTGGNIFYVATKLKNRIFAEKNLVLIGLNRILQYNA